MVLCWVLYGVLGGLNVAGYLLTAHDKRAAQAQGRRSDPPDRIPERVLHLVAAIGGWVGIALAMRHVRHKTRKRGFQAILVLASILGTLGWIGWLLVFECIEPGSLPGV